MRLRVCTSYSQPLHTGPDVACRKPPTCGFRGYRLAPRSGRRDDPTTVRVRSDVHRARNCAGFGTTPSNTVGNKTPEIFQMGTHPQALGQRRISESLCRASRKSRTICDSRPGDPRNRSECDSQARRSPRGSRRHTRRRGPEPRPFRTSSRRGRKGVPDRPCAAERIRLQRYGHAHPQGQAADRADRVQGHGAGATVGPASARFDQGARLPLPGRDRRHRRRRGSQQHRGHT